MACKRCEISGPPPVADKDGTPSHVQVWQTRSGPVEILFECEDAHLYKEFVIEIRAPHCERIGMMIEKLKSRKISVGAHPGRAGACERAEPKGM